MDSKRSLSQASEALEISSRRKISLCEYSECVTRCRTWATSASKARVSVFVVIGAVRIAWPWTRGYARDGADFKLGDVRGCVIRAGIAGPGARESRFCRRIRRFVAPCLRAPAAARTVVVAARAAMSFDRRPDHENPDRPAGLVRVVRAGLAAWAACAGVVAAGRAGVAAEIGGESGREGGGGYC